MELQVTGINIEITPQIRSHIEKKLGKLSRHMPNIMESRVEITEEKTKSPQQRYLVRVTVDGKGAVFHGEERGEDLVKAIDRAAATLVRQLDHYKGKLHDKGRNISAVKAELGEAPAAEEPERKVVKTKRFVIKPMSLAEAIEQMEVLGHDFFLFFNADVNKLNLLYRRKDGNYGLIEPELG